MSVLSKPYFHDEAKAFEYLESILWADGIVCPHCGVVGGRVYELKGKSTRLGLKKCGECRQQFTVKVGTVFEHGRMPLNKMLQAVYLMTCSKKGVSAHQLHRTLEITYKSAAIIVEKVARQALATIQSFEAQSVAKEDKSRHEFGTIDASVAEAKTYHGQPALYVRERLTKKLIPCVLSEEAAKVAGPTHSWTEVWSGKRVRIKGEIFYDRSGSISRVRATSLIDVNPTPVNLAELRQINLLDGKSPSEHLDRLWGYGE